MFGRIFIDGSVEWLGFPDFHRNDGPAWTANLLDTYPSWGYGGSTTNTNWGSQSGGASGRASIPWNCPTCVLTVYHCMISENARAAARRVCDNLLQGNPLARMRSPYTRRNPICNQQVNWQDDDWNGLVDKQIVDNFRW